MTKDEIALDALCLQKFGRGFFDLPDVTDHAALFAAGYSAQDVFDVYCLHLGYWLHEKMNERKKR